MSKSDPESAIFMEDSETDIKTKIKTAYCPPGVIKGNPCADYVKNIVFGANK
jgi:tyrosyl-tRNA synthetase